ncbi:MAG: adenosine deaminase [Leptospiraceae bacterium]|nr:adenosine deaminase [Leptospiraceae bacterium]
MGLLDLHNHLYGSLTAETLFEIGKRNPKPRWNLFTDLYEKLYGKVFRTENFFRDYSDLSRFQDLYFFNKPAPFIEFQSKFNLIIALSKFDEEEIKFVAKEVVLEHATQGVEFAEYRIMYAPNATKEIYFSKTLAACEGLRLGELASQSKIQAKTILSLHRDGNFQEQYKWLKELLAESDLVRKYLVGIDFCFIEEGFPPCDKKFFFEKVLEDNEKNPHLALSILYHVGESYADKTPKSAVRWVGESAIWGAHRLGHCIALGINPETFANKNIYETAKERIEQIKFEIQNYEKLKPFGVTSDYSKLKQELELLIHKNPEEKILFTINKKYIDELNTFQEFTMTLIRDESKSVIECCPTSNILIGMIPDWKQHPIRRFVDHNLRVTISSDDPGIFDTSLQKEYEIAANSGLSVDELEKIKNISNLYTSEKLTGKIQ